MAKTNEAFSVKKEVVVNSPAYGRHTRAARGSRTHTTVNDALAAHADKTKRVNTAAKGVYDVLTLYGHGFREGQLWQAVLSRMRKAKHTDFKTLLESLDGLELNSRYALKRFGPLPVVSAWATDNTLNIQLRGEVPSGLLKNSNCRHFELIVPLFDVTGACVQHDVQQTRWLYNNDARIEQIFQFNKPQAAVHYLICLHLQSGVNDIATDVLAGRGMAIVGVGGME
jgi:hypothetical protein